MKTKQLHELIKRLDEATCEIGFVHDKLKGLQKSIWDALKIVEEELGIIECEDCGTQLDEEDAVPINDGSTDYTPKVCPDCAGGEQ